MHASAHNNLLKLILRAARWKREEIHAAFAIHDEFCVIVRSVVIAAGTVS